MHHDTFQIIWGRLCLWILAVGVWALWSVPAEHATSAGCAKQPSRMEGSRRQHALCLAHLVLLNRPCGWEILASNHASHSSRKKQRFLSASLFPRRICVSSGSHYLIWQPFPFEFLLLDPDRWLITISFTTLPLSRTSPAPSGHFRYTGPPCWVSSPCSFFRQWTLRHKRMFQWLEGLYYNRETRGKCCWVTELSPTLCDPHGL